MRSLAQPRVHASQIDGGRRRHVLQVGSREPTVAAAPQAERTHPLGDRPFDSRTSGVESTSLFARMTRTCHPEGLMLRAWLQEEVSALAAIARAELPHRAGATLGGVEADRDVLATAIIRVFAPAEAGFPVGAEDD
jgi:hypothetical protein